MAKGIFTCFQIMKPTMHKWAQYPAPMEAICSLVALFRPLTQQKWPRDRKLTQSCGCLHWFLGSSADVWKILLQVHTRPVVTQVYIEKMFNKHIKIGFQRSVFHLVSERSCHYCEMREGWTQWPLFRARENRQSTSYNLNFLQSYIQFRVLINVMRGWRSLGY